jgi:hypothetical protein
LMIICIVLAVISCKQDNHEPGNIAGLPFTAKINGVPFSATATYCTLRVDSNNPLRRFELIGMYNEETISILFMDTVLTEIVDSNAAAKSYGLYIFYSYSHSNEEYIPLNSTLVFSKFDTLTNKTSGKFSSTLIGLGDQALFITDGYFNDIPYTLDDSN